MVLVNLLMRKREDAMAKKPIQAEKDPFFGNLLGKKGNLKKKRKKNLTFS